MKKILIIYFSGAGSTEKIAELMRNRLLQDCKADIFPIESDKFSSMASMENYDALIIGTPTVHAAPAKVVTDYFNTLNLVTPLTKYVPAFVFNTRGLYSLNTNRILSKILRRNKIITVMDRSYRCPASDGSILAPFIKRFFEFEKDIDKKIERDCAVFLELLKNVKSVKSGNLKGYIPRFRFGSILNAPNKAAGQFFTFKIYLHKDACNKCAKCIKQCPYSAISADINNYPLIDSKKCENCYRCIHRCLNLALSLRKKKKIATSLFFS